MNRSALLAVALCACEPRLEVPAGAHLRCASTADCPAGLVCRQALGLCAKSDGDITPPRLTAPAVIAPTLAMRGTELEIRFAVDEPASAEVSLEMRDHVEAATRVEDGVYRYVARGDEPEGLVRAYATLTDTDGNVARGVSLGIFTLDFTAPRLVTSTLGDGGVLLGPGAGATVAFFVDEPLATSRVRIGAAEAVETPQPSRLFFAYRYTADGGEPEGATGVVADVSDEAGNRAALQLGTFVFDFTAPRPFDPTKVTYSRNPTEMKYSVRAEPGAFEPESVVRVYATPDSGVAAETPGDLPTVYVSQVDRAGNESPRQEVKRIELEINFAGKASGSFATNPHAAFHAESTGGEPRPVAELDSTEYAALSGIGSPWTSTPGVINWLPVAPPVGRSGHAMTYDETRGQVILFGGVAAGGYAHLNDTWVWNGTAWANKISPAPPARRAHAMVFDTTRRRAVLFGGYDGAARLADTWEWDGNAWAPRSPPSSPSARSGHAMAYDGARGRVVLFGGFANGALANDTWEWDGATWTRRAPAAAPAPRSAHAMAYDSARGRVVLVGGFQGSYFFNDTWEWDGTTWTQRQNAAYVGQTPALAFDGARNRIVLFGTDVSEWDGTSWTHPTSASSPPPRTGHALAFDAAHGRTVLFGGSGLRDTWTWDGARWAEAPRPVAPPPTSGHAMAFDEARERTVLFSGADTWEWDGSGWEKKLPATSPPPRSTPAMAFDSRRGRVVLSGGGTYDDTWEWDGTTWSDRTTLPRPLGAAGHALAFDSARGRTVWFGPGDTGPQDETWEWDGTSWTRMYPAASPPPRTNVVMAFDAARGHVVLFGGYDTINLGLLNDTWEWDGANWTERVSLSPPPAREAHAMAFDPGRGHVVLFGGRDQNGDLDDTREFDGTGWLVTSPEASPPARSGHAMAFDSARGRLVIFGGQGLDDTWQSSSSTLRALLVSGSTLGAAHVDSLELCASASGESDAGSGVIAEAWSQNRWWPFASTSSSSLSPITGSFDAGLDGEQVIVRLRPRGPTLGLSASSLRLRATYRRP